MIRNILALVLSASLVAGCVGRPKLIGGEQVTVTQNVELPPPSTDDLRANQQAYRIGPFDKLEIDVFGVEDLKCEIQADASGRVSFPLAGEIEAAGLTPHELAEAIEARLRGQYVRNPQVTVNLKEAVSRIVTVEGSVREPGLYPVLGKMTLIRAVASAKGVTDTADLQHAVVFRTVNGQRLAALYSIKAVREGLYPDPELYPDDVVVVGESAAKRLFKDLVQLAPLLTAPIIATLSNNNN